MFKFIKKGEYGKSELHVMHDDGMKTIFYLSEEKAIELKEVLLEALEDYDLK